MNISESYKFINNAVCKFCDHNMEHIYYHCDNYDCTETYIYWCPYCGAILYWYDKDPIQDSDWKEPIMTKDCI